MDPFHATPHRTDRTACPHLLPSTPLYRASSPLPTRCRIYIQHTHDTLPTHVHTNTWIQSISFAVIYPFLHPRVQPTAPPPQTTNNAQTPNALPSAVCVVQGARPPGHCSCQRSSLARPRMCLRSPHSPENSNEVFTTQTTRSAKLAPRAHAVAQTSVAHHDDNGRSDDRQGHNYECPAQEYQ
jgi:hypothetical protein